jgi:hypothetical protein
VEAQETERTQEQLLVRESVLFIGTQFSNIYTAVDLTVHEVLPGGQELEVGPFSLEPNTKTPIRAATSQPCSASMCISGTHPVLSVPTRNGASAKELPVLTVHELCLF